MENQKVIRDFDGKRKKNTHESYQMMYSIFLCLRDECRLPTDDCVEMLQRLFPRSKQMLMSNLVWNCEVYDKIIDDFHREIAATLYRFYSKVDGKMLKLISKKLKK